MIIAPIRYSNKDPRVTFYKTGSILFNKKAVKELELLGENRFILDISPKNIQLILNNDGFRFSQNNLARKIYRLNSRQVATKIFELFGKKDTKTISFICKREDSEKINLIVKSVERLTTKED
jgi:hypothetical protein